MGNVIDPFICPSLAKGIRRAYLEALDASWADFGQRVRAFRRRSGGVKINSQKALHREVERFKTKLMPQFLSAADIGVQSGRKEAWMIFTLAHLQDSATVIGRAGVSCTFFGYPHVVDVRDLPVEFTGHAIDRLIQRAHVVDLPLSKSDLNAIHAGFSSAMIWAAAAAKAMLDLSAEEHRSTDVIIPADHGIFLGRFDTQALRLILTTFVDSAKLWDEETYALSQLTQLGEERLALSALDLVANGWMAHDDTQVSESLVEIWRAFGWVIREREERPGKMDAAWLARTEEGGKGVLDD